MKTVKKITLATLSILAVAGSIVTYVNLGVEQASANPDYICVKSVSNTPCNVTHYEDWQPDGTRIGYGYRTSAVFYRLTRTDCEPGYSRSRVGSIDGESGRRTGDMPYSTTSCTIVQVDAMAPVGAGG
ncbi:MAG: hypothetical protein N4A38_03070 [Candidatus Gracilibacteria bacterium]|nr:hypothetical protein [Candidatus Gracilibacteria bacterium]